MRQAALVTLAVLAITGCKLPAPRCLPCSTYLPSNLDAAGGSEACPVAGSEAPSPDFENLVFQGGGVKGIAYAGALPAFGDKRLAKVGRVAGTSAGAITALGVAVGYDTEQLCKISLAIDYPSFEDGSFPEDAVRLFEDYGWYKGDYAQCFLECLVERQTGSKETTFAELHELRQQDPKFKDLFVFGTDVNTYNSVEFSHEAADKRDVPLALATRISMSIPFFFAAKELQGDIFVDGGVLRNYPLDVFDKQVPNPASLGFHLGAEPPRESIDDFLQFSEGVFFTLLEVQVDRTCRTPADVERSVFIDTLGISTTDFGITREQKLALIEQGEKATRAYLEESVHPTTCPVFALELQQPL